MSAQKLAEWMRARLTDPAHVAKTQAQTAETKVAAQLAAMQKRLDDALAARDAEREAAETQRNGESPYVIQLPGLDLVEELLVSA